MIVAGHHPADHQPTTRPAAHEGAQRGHPTWGDRARARTKDVTMKKLIGLGMAALAAIALTAGCSKASTPNDQAAAADAQLGLGNCTQLATTWAQLFTPLQAGGASDDAKANIKKQISDMKAKVPANIGADLDKISTGVDNAKSPTDVATFVSSADFSKANQDVATYLTTQCK
jgi:hypothetical protein